MRAKTILTVLFLISIGVAVIVLLKAMPTLSGAETQEAARDEILVAAGSLPAGTLLRPQDLEWQKAKGDTQPGMVVRPDQAARDLKPDLEEEARSAVYGAALRKPLTEGEPIRRADISRPGARDFLDIVLAPGTRAMSIPITVIGPPGSNARLIGPFPGDRVDLVLTQTFKDASLPITRHSVGEAVVQNVRVLANPLPDPKSTANNNNSEIKTALMLEVTPEEAEKITVAEELGKLAVTLRGTSSGDHVVASSTLGPAAAPGVAVAAPGPATPPGAAAAGGIRAVWAGDVSPALGGTMPEKVVIVDAPPVDIIRGSKSEQANPPWHSEKEGGVVDGGARPEKAAAANSNSTRQ